MNQHSYQRTIRRYFEEVWNEGRLEVLDEIFDPDHVHHDPGLPPDLAPGREAFKGFVRSARAGLPDIHFHVIDVFGEGDLVAARWTAHATHTGTFLGILATGKQVAVTGIDIVRFSEGRMAEAWANWDTLGLLRQLGVVPVG